MTTARLVLIITAADCGVLRSDGASRYFRGYLTFLLVDANRTFPLPDIHHLRELLLQEDCSK